MFSFKKARGVSSAMFIMNNGGTVFFIIEKE